MGDLIVAALLVLPLALDTFALAAALGLAGIPPSARRRTSLVLALFEGGMPIVGFVAGGAIGGALGSVAGWTAIVVLAISGILMLRPGSEDAESARVRLLARAQGLAILDLGLAISVDELGVGFSLGLLGFPLVVVIPWIAVQAFLAAQAGMRLGTRLGEELRERAERVAGLAVLGTAGVLLVLKLVRGGP